MLPNQSFWREPENRINNWRFYTHCTFAYLVYLLIGYSTWLTKSQTMSNSFLSRCISSNNGLMAEGSETRFKVGLNELSLHSRWKLLSELVIVALLKKNKQDRQKVGCQKLHWLSYLPTVTEFLWASNSREISLYEQAIIISAAGRALLDESGGKSFQRVW